ncbi:aminotransferase class I/II-fold pyridoxal phosphate-dependent enzyme [Chryseolinea lacunae]|uniref:8-amino-7-oxononanoate synthase n=1 Tax=Chryseolinea lacunae TaxID=2801331 RepID=A0ABS1L343_9BACT|nr:8-amino-7-oxononanoate synthase [Chryseolinea lacunae]MBL0745922.1 8-amino-7-oxononanoate synthase [Chryseolinea lacunae]
MESLDPLLEKRLAERRDKGLERTLKIARPGLVDFTSNDYLGLSRSPELFESILAHTSSPQPNGSTGSRLLSGNSAAHEALEKKLATIFKSETTLLFAAGYNANLAVLSSLPQRGDTILYDELAHASMKDGARLSLAKRLNFKHNDLHDLEQKLKNAQGQIFIAVESIYSMDGDECPLRELTLLAEKHNAIIILDEAHSTGVMGHNGNGLAVSLGLQDKIGVRIYTFGKAMGIHGACVAGSKRLRNYLINFSRPFIYTTAISHHSVATMACAFDYLQQNMPLQTMLRERIMLYTKSVADLPNRTFSNSAIQTVIFPGNEVVRQVALSLQQKGFDVRPILSPTVPTGTERLRICLHVYNTEEEIARLTHELRTLALSGVMNNG